MRYKIRTVTPLDEVPLAVSVEDLKAFMKVETSLQDGPIGGMARTAQEMVEDFTGQVLTTREMEMITCGFPVLPELIILPRDPVTEILSMAYTDPSTGEPVAMVEADWRWSDAMPEQLQPAWQQAWPVSAAEMGGLRIGFMAGYENGLCPAKLTEAVKKTVLQLHEGRELGGRLSDDVQAGLLSFRPLLG